jgi:hypothetical protein
MPSLASRYRRPLLALAVVAVAVAVLVPVLRSRPDTPTGLRGMVAAIDFADPRHGYALLTDCESGCPWRVEATRDGATWLPRTAPSQSGGPDIGLDVLGEDTVVATQAGVRWFSRDGARTWQRLPPGLVSPADSVPTGAKLFVGCTDWRLADCSNPRVLVTLPESGAVAPLSVQPEVDLDFATAQPVPAADGGWWISADGGSNGRPALAVSRDDGRSWVVSHPPDPNAEGIGVVEVVSGRGFLYAVAVSVSSQERGSLHAFYRGVDDGRGWEMTWRPDTWGTEISGTPVVTSAGEIILSTPHGEHAALISRDGGRTFTPADEPELGWVTWTRAGYLSARGTRHSISTDGVTWRDLGGG